MNTNASITSQRPVLRTGLTFAAASVILAAAATASADLVVFDNMSNYQGGNTNARIASTGSTPNTFMGQGYVLTPGTTVITGFDLYPVNLSGANFTSIKLNIFVWGGVNTGTVNASTPAFSSLLGSYSFTDTGAYNTGFFYPQEGTPVGSAPGVVLGSPLAISSTTIGLSFNYQGSTDGVTYNSANSLTSLIAYGMPASVGSQVFNGYYRNAASEVDGNFVSTLRSLGQTDQSLGLRVYTIPEPSIFALAGLASVGLLVFRRRN
jgi:hypothetical protein